VAALIVDKRQVVVRLAVWEKVLALRGNVRMPLSAVRGVRVVPDPTEDLKQYLSGGNTLTYRYAYGVRRIPGVGKAFVATHGHGPAVLVMLDPPSKFVRLLITVADPKATVASIEAAAGV
jgi:hypothetical protein